MTLSYVKGEGVTVKQLVAQIVALEQTANRTPTQDALLRLLRTCLNLRTKEDRP